MLFAGLIGMYLVFRLSQAWPPPDLPRLPVGVAALNTHRALRQPRSADPRAAWRAARTTARAAAACRSPRSSARSSSRSRASSGCDCCAHGLTPGSSVYGGTFYLLIGCHALHVLAAVVWLAVLAVLDAAGPPHAGAPPTVWRCAPSTGTSSAALWAVLFPLVYLY